MMILALLDLSGMAQSFTLHGRVVDEEGNPVEFASVSCLQQGSRAKKTKRTTDFAGDALRHGQHTRAS